MPGVFTVIGSSKVSGFGGQTASAFIAATASDQLNVLRDDKVRFYGQPVAVVVADSSERAEYAAAALRSHTRHAVPSWILPDPEGAATVPHGGTPAVRTRRGDADAALAIAPVKPRHAMRSLAKSTARSRLPRRWRHGMAIT